ncbi:hypothetical protein HR11_08455 [Porphyromonas macacae]|uniref:Uncharacterized protein n=1 Tax=Porphyromonas macacae TaxID=28115 RepID=A0A0A2GDK2_9PORP|nr:DUF5606 domain-containing protein [Porphyromonas macacae]KGN72302.1 hypothetical protein HQ47_10185 [Porphyromonas macacae]KGN98554.1 hypothetical protein HR11_08455 [Porphyromonas macacae]SUB88384.1 Uncharacterised protein [Porphyromonas macacae]
MLKKILSISGKPGLYKLISQGKNNIIVESLLNGRRIPARVTDRIVSLADISMYTTSEDKPLVEVLELLRIHQEGGKKIDLTLFKDNEALRDFMASFMPDFDRERIYPSDIKKLFQWYNILIDYGFNKFEEEKTEEEPAEETTQTEATA